MTTKLTDNKTHSITSVDLITRVQPDPRTDSRRGKVFTFATLIFFSGESLAKPNRFTAHRPLPVMIRFRSHFEVIVSVSFHLDFL